MNKHLQLIVDFLAQSTHLTEAEKSDLLQAAKAAEKDLAITAFKLERTEKVKHTTSILLEETIQELEQKRKAIEVQNRELAIESALERVRSRSMGMQKSDELKEVIKIVYHQLRHLKINLDHAGFIIDYIPKGDWHFWIADEQDIPSKITHPYFESVWANQFNEAKEKGVDLFATNLNFEEKNKFYNELLSHVPGLPEASKDFYLSCPGLAASTVLLENIGLYIENFAGSPYTDEENATLMRFGKVFQQTYIRFLDLQKAEAQAREAKIEASLERVRSRSMAMHKSDEVLDTANVLYQELKLLGFEFGGVIIIIMDETNGDMEHWFSGFDQEKYPQCYRVPYFEHPLYRAQLDGWQNGETYKVIEIGGELKKSYDQNMFSRTDYIHFPEQEKQWMLKAESVLFSFAYMKHGALMWGPTPISENEALILQRFAKVFEQTYTRFLDLQKAEAQAREAQIEAALERVRSVAMSMMKSDDLLTICQSAFTQLQTLGFKNLRAAQIYIRNDEEEKFMNYDYALVTGADKVEVNYNGHPNTRRIYDIIRNAGDGLVYNVIEKEQLDEWKSYLYNTLGQPPEESLDAADGLHYYLYSFGIGAFGICTFKVISTEELDILKRFRNVFNLSYQRYTDIALAEAQTREAKIETALERVRSRTLAMQKSDELAETAAEVFRQLINLGIEPNRLYIGIVKGQTGDMEMWATDEDGTHVGKKFMFNKNENASVKKLFDGWNAKEKSVIVDMQGKELEDYFHYLNNVMLIPFKGGLTQKRRVQSVAYFSEGFIGMASPDGQGDETIQLLERFAAVFNLTFTRFNDLKIAEAHALQAEQDLIAITEAKQKAEAALTILQTTQKQLIQSEKMASLGELTAGIAHEIQNPLNFVNNFSEVNSELIEELRSQKSKLKTEEQDEILNDIFKNNEKINHHGKRADAIVKGMLQHSRSSTGVKEPTDINALCDEYFRLAYHGLRAKDKSFNATMKTHFDETIGNINIIPQDIGRVILNLITNAFFVVHEKKQSGIANYEPTVEVKTSKNPPLGGRGAEVVIKVSDNGPGIPQKILDKIFQPFFTTKPTGQGTGLGLSLSYDIVKAHGGEIRVETKEGEARPDDPVGRGSEFIILLPVV